MLPKGPPARYNAAHYYSALYVRGAIRGFLARHTLRPLMWNLMGAPDEGDDELPAEVDAVERKAILMKLGVKVGGGGVLTNLTCFSFWLTSLLLLLLLLLFLLAARSGGLVGFLDLQSNFIHM